MKKGGAIKEYMINRTVYSLTIGAKPSFKDLTYSSKIETPCMGLYEYPERVLDGAKFELSNWDLKLPGMKDGIYLFMCTATLKYSNGRQELCSFKPVILVNGKVLTPAFGI